MTLEPLSLVAVSSLASKALAVEDDRGCAITQAAGAARARGLLGNLKK